jgi:aromatic-amino-acid transaminase
MAFGKLESPTPDSLLTLMSHFRADPRARKVDLGVGVYRDAHGDTPVFNSVKRAERRLCKGQLTKAYLGTLGDPDFVAALARRALGSDSLAGLQTVGGTGALRLAAELLARTLPQRRIWVGVPTWSNHVPIFNAAGLPMRTVELFDSDSRCHRPDALLDALGEAKPGDAVLLHGCCHNPTGVDPDAGFWMRIADHIRERGLVPLVDMAYQGLGRGWEADSAGLRLLAERVPHLIVAYSCDKNFGLYRERVGALFIRGSSARETATLIDHLAALARADYSMPPDHGAAVVRVILENPELTAAWDDELTGMRSRIRGLRNALAAYGRIGTVDLSALAEGHGMFAMLALTVAQIEALRADHGIYMATSGRINIAGLANDQVAAFVDALHAVQRQPTAVA